MNKLIERINIRENKPAFKAHKKSSIFQTVFKLKNYEIKELLENIACSSQGLHSN